MVKRNVINSLMLLIVAALVVTVSFAWPQNSYLRTQDVIGKSNNASLDSYFEGGSGTALDPYQIINPEQYYNFTYLQDAGEITSGVYFRLGVTEGVPVVIDFTEEIQLLGAMHPVGNADNPFVGTFDGNGSTLQNIIVDGMGQQDIGFFGFLGATGVVQDLFLERLTVVSEPSSTDDTSGYHTHVLGQYSIATGIVVGHIEDGGIISGVYAISPMVVQLSNDLINRSQLGLIGYDDSTGGYTPGSPDSAYDFDFDSTSAYTQLVWALGQYGSYYVNGSSSILLSNVLSTSPATSQKLKLATGYSLSSLRISSTPGDTSAPYLYDVMVSAGHPIGSETNGYFNREYLDLVGEILWVEQLPEYNFNVNANNSITIPYDNTTFTPSTYAKTVILYVRPTTDPNDLGKLTTITTGGGGLTLYVGGTPGSSKTNYTIDSSGGENTLDVAHSFCSVDIDISTGVITVDYTDPEYYVFLVGVNNGSSTIKSLHFSFVPAGLNEQSLGSIEGTDFVNDPSDVLDPNFEVSYLNMSYTVLAGQSYKMRVDRLQSTDSNSAFDYSATYDFRIILYGDPDATTIQLTILNVSSTTTYMIEIYQISNPSLLDHDWYPDVETQPPTPIYTGSNDLIQVHITSTSTADVSYGDY